MSLIFLFNVEFIISCWYIESADSYNCSYFPHLFICVCVKVMPLDIPKFKISSRIHLKTFLVPLCKSCPRSTQYCQCLCIFPWYVIHSKQNSYLFSLRDILYPLTSVDSYSDLCLQLGGKKSIVYKCLSVEPDCQNLKSYHGKLPNLFSLFYKIFQSWLVSWVLDLFSHIYFCGQKDSYLV